MKLGRIEIPQYQAVHLKRTSRDILNRSRDRKNSNSGSFNFRLSSRESLRKKTSNRDSFDGSRSRFESPSGAKKPIKNERKLPLSKLLQIPDVNTRRCRDRKDELKASKNSFKPPKPDHKPPK